MENNIDLEKKTIENPMNNYNTKEEQEDDDLPVMIEAPDGGWGWLIVFASFMCNVIVDGIIFSYGLFIPELAEAFGETKGRLTWVGSILAGFYLIAGPVVSGFANAYGCRPVTIIGTLISAASFAVSSLAPNMIFLCISFGLFGGIGFGFIYLPAVVTVGFYFEKKRAFATGLAVCGSGVGTFVMAPLVKYLLEKYSWKGTMLVLSGIILHCVIFGALFKPLQPKPKPKVEEQEELPSEKTLPLLQRIKEYRDAQKETWESQECLGITSIPPAPLTSSLPEVSKFHEKDIEKCKAVDKNSPSSSNNNSPPPSYSEVIEEDERISFLCSQRQPRKSLPIIIIPKKTLNYDTSYRRRQNNSTRDQLRPFYRQDILYSASLLNLPQFRSQPDLESYHKSVTMIPKIEDDAGNSNACCSPVVRETFKQMLDLSLLRSPTFLVFATGGFLTLAGFFVPFMFIIDRAITCGVPEDDATYILPMIGLTNTVGRVFSGWVSDRPNLDALTINNIALIVGGLATIFSPFVSTFPMFLLYAAVFGFAIACFATLRSIIVVELLGLEKLTNAFGLLLLFQGIASMIGAPVAGMFYDMTGSYDASFYIAGTLILLSGILGFPLPYICRWEKRRQERKLKSITDIQIIVEDYNPNSVHTPVDV